MCGIFGIANCGDLTYDKANAFRKATRALLEESQIRGSKASGLCVSTGAEAVMYKDGIPAKRLIHEPEYSKVLRHINQYKNFRIMLGHTRAPTKGSPEFNVNNHPIKANRVIGVHNGLIHNDDTLFRRHKKEIERAGQVDSEIIFRLIDYHISKGKSLVRAVKETHEVLQGSYACAFIDKSNPRYLTLFCDAYSDLILFKYVSLGVIVFASTEHIARRALKDNPVLSIPQATWKKFVKNTCIRIDTQTGKVYSADLNDPIGTGEGCRFISPMFQGCSGFCDSCDYYGVGGQ